MTNTIYVLSPTPSPVDISQYLTDDNFVETEVGGTVTLHQQGDMRLILPNTVNYMIRNEDSI